MEIMVTRLSRVAPEIPTVREDGLCVCLVKGKVARLGLLETEKQLECLIRPTTPQEALKHLRHCHAHCLPITACLD